MSRFEEISEITQALYSPKVDVGKGWEKYNFGFLVSWTSHLITRSLSFKISITR